MLVQLLEAAFRSFALGAAVWLSLRLLSVQYPQARMTAWTVVLAASVSMLLLMHQFVVTIPGYSPRIPNETVEHGSPASATRISAAPIMVPSESSASPSNRGDAAPAQGVQSLVGEQLIGAGEQLINAIDWQPIAVGIYISVAGGLLLRLLIGLTLTWRLLGMARPIATDWTAGADVRISAAIATPVTFGTVILLPDECLGWSPSKRQAVLAHERSHAVRGDFYVLLLAMLHRAVFWFSPFSWWLLSELVKTAELVSDDAAIEVLGDHSAYAEILLDVARSARKAPVGIAMARTRIPFQRVDRILAFTVPSKLGWGRQALVAVSLAPLVAMTVSVANEIDPTAISSTHRGPSTGIFEPAASAPKLWILGRVYRNANPDEMFGVDAAWKTVAAHTAVVKLLPAALWNAEDQDLKRAFQNLAARHIDLAFEIHVLVRTGRCTQKTRGYSDPGEVEEMLERIQRLGGDPRYFDMAAPFYFGHRWSGAGSCHGSPEDLARQIAQILQLIHVRFPKAEIGTSELVLESTDWTDELVNWADVYERVTGEPLAFFHAEVAWSDPATKNLEKLVSAMRARHIPFGITYDGDEESGSSDEWEESALRRITEIESSIGLRPDAAIFKAASNFPSRLLPETQPGTVTNLAYQYVLAPASMTLTRQANIVSGAVVDALGHPVAAANVVVEAVDAAGRMDLTERHLTGKVPQNAAAALVAILVNTGGSCVCAGAASASIGAIRYREITTGRSEEIPPFLPAAGEAHPSVRFMRRVPDETMVLDLKLFPTSPGASFQLDAPLTVTVNGERAGHIVIMFLDSNGQEIRRDRLWFRPSVRGLGNVVTDAEGRFHVEVPSWVADAGAEIRASFPGNDLLAFQTVTVSQDQEQASTIPRQRAPEPESRTANR
jgi:beta-lactamase regulating signal transducer with metallopeptidase domain